jgi:hypothetical protein
MKRMQRHLTFANVVAVVALFVALSAGAWAAGLKKNSVGTKKIKDGAVSVTDLQDNAVTGAKVVDGSVGGVDVGDDTITGSEIDESSLQGIKVATTDSVGGMQIKDVDYRNNIGSNVVENILVFPNIFRIDAQCANFGDGLDIAAFTAVDNSVISMSSNAPFTSPAQSTDADGTQDIKSGAMFDFDSNAGFPIDNNLAFGIREHATINFATPSGFVATIQLAVEESNGSCKIGGTAIGG